MRLMLTYILLLSFFSSYSQDTIEVKEELSTGILNKQPSFPGGNAALIKFLNENLRYPKEAQEKQIQGKVSAEFIIEKDGSISNINIIKSIGGGCDEETIRVIKKMPKWTPGEQKGSPVRVKYILPVSFYLGRKAIKKRKRIKLFKQNKQ